MKPRFPIIPTCLFFLLAALPAHAETKEGVEVIQEIESPATGKTPVRFTTKSLTPWMRIEMKDSVTLVNSTSGDIITLLPSQKTYIRIPGSIAQKMKDLASRFQPAETAEQPAPEAPPEFEPTGRKETIQGYECGEYRVKNGGGSLSVWIAKDPAAAALFREYLQMLASSQSDKDPLAFTREPLEMIPPDLGLPVRVDYQAGPASVSMTLISVKKQKFDPAEFAPPRDYKPLSLPGGIGDLLKTN